jgi:hypothetical protein
MTVYGTEVELIETQVSLGYTNCVPNQVRHKNNVASMASDKPKPNDYK